MVHTRLGERQISGYRRKPGAKANTVEIAINHSLPLCYVQWYANYSTNSKEAVIWLRTSFVRYRQTLRGVFLIDWLGYRRLSQMKLCNKLSVTLGVFRNVPAC